MNKSPNNSVCASALQGSMAVVLICLSAILFASNFRADTPQQPKRTTRFGGPDGSFPPVPISVIAPTFTMDIADGFGINEQTVSVSNVDPALQYNGFQGDLIFDSAIAEPFLIHGNPVARGGLTSNSPWNVSGVVLNSGPGTLKTLRISAFGNTVDNVINGSGPLFVIHWKRVSSTVGQSAPVTWAPSPNDFIFIDCNLDAWAATPQNNGMITITEGTFSISGHIAYCPNPTAPSLPGVLLTRTPSDSGAGLSDESGNYVFSSFVSGDSYTVTPSKAALHPGYFGIDTTDTIATQRHFLGLSLLTGCRLTAADVNGDGHVDTVDVTGINRFYLGQSTGIGNTGNYKFIPPNRQYTPISGNQTNQSYDAFVVGDVAMGFVHRPSEQSPDMAEGNELPATVAMLALPALRVDQFRGNFVAPVTTSAIDGRNRLVGFQGDMTFDERVVRFEEEPVEKAGLTSGNWVVAGNVLPGTGPIRTLRVAGYSTDFQPLSGEGPLFQLKVSRIHGGRQGAAKLTWSGAPNQFIFIDADLKAQLPASARSSN
jgi:hypothetical protein